MNKFLYLLLILSLSSCVPQVVEDELEEVELKTRGGKAKIPVGLPVPSNGNNKRFIKAYQVLAINCLSCHSGVGNPNGNLDLRTQQAWLDQGSYIKPNNWEDSFLKKKLANYAKGNMPPEPLSILSDSDVAILQNWVDKIIIEEPSEEPKDNPTLTLTTDQLSGSTLTENILTQVFGPSMNNGDSKDGLLYDEVKKAQGDFGDGCDKYNNVPVKHHTYTYTVKEFKNEECNDSFYGGTPYTGSTPLRLGHLMRVCEKAVKETTSFEYALNRVKDLRANSNQLLFKVRKIVENKCLSCHGSASGRSLDYNTVKGWLWSGYVAAGNPTYSKLWTKLKPNGGNMPTGNTLTNEEVTTIKAFIEELAKDNLNGQPEDLNIDTQNINNSYKLFAPDKSLSSDEVTKIQELANMGATPKEKWQNVLLFMCINPDWQKI